MSMKLMWVDPAMRAVCPGLASRSMLRQPSRASIRSASCQAGSVTIPAATASAPVRANSGWSARIWRAGRGRPTVPTSVQIAPSRLAEARHRASVRHHSSAALPPKECPNAPTDVRSRWPPVSPARLGPSRLEVVGDEAQVGGLVVADLGAATERRVVGADLGAEGAAEGGGVHGCDMAVAEHGDGGLVGVVDADDDVAVAGQFLGDRAEEQR